MKWISVNESLPEPGERVLFATEVFVGEGYYSMAEEKWFRYGNNYSVESLLGEVIAWMPMPEYKEDTANE